MRSSVVAASLTLARQAVDKAVREKGADMPLPASHIRALKRDLRAHEERLTYLHGQIAHFSEEARFHENLIELGRDQRILLALDELASNPDLVDELAADKAAYARRRGIDLPESAELEVEPRRGGAMVLLHFKHGGWDYSCMWDSEKGFTVEPADTEDTASDVSGQRS
jgi:hypothetical protein